MRRGFALPFVVMMGGLTGCGAAPTRADAGAAELQARSVQAEARREHARLVELEVRLLEMERRLAGPTPACEVTPDAQAAGVENPRERPKTEPLRSQGDFLAEARVPTPGRGPQAAKVAVGATPLPATPGSERQRLEQLLEGLREYASDPQSGLSLERREALRVLLRRERQLDLMNPWGDR
ncbi:MAG TPA: hypothetical protein VGQ57_07685 [Polyangiaceae bacterium]|nr:hypothetical protein [Polyangiaceae bacterium]